MKSLTDMTRIQPEDSSHPRKSVHAALITGTTSAAIASVEVRGENPARVLEGIASPLPDAVGKMRLAEISVEGRTIDQALAVLESSESLLLHCHGNPIITEALLKALAGRGVDIISDRDMLKLKLNSSDETADTIAVEAELAQYDAGTLSGIKIIHNQTRDGLCRLLETMPDTPVENIAYLCKQMIDNTLIAEHIINGIKIAIAGPPNSGKSTLLNTLCGTETALVADIAGTTRDYVTAETVITAGGITYNAELCDTAGLDRSLTVNDDIDAQSQQAAVELIQSSDIVIYMQAVSDTDSSPRSIRDLLDEDTPILHILNKADTLDKRGRDEMGDKYPDAIIISAVKGWNVELIADRISDMLGITDFDPTAAVCFTQRQKRLVNQLTGGKNREEFDETINELLHGETRQL